MTKTIRNYIAALAALSFLMVPTIANADFLGYAMGVTVQGGAAEVKAFETDPEGTKIDGLAKEEVLFPSLFAEMRYGIHDRLSVAVGVDLLPASAEFVQESKADTDLTTKAGGTNTGTSKVTGKFKNQVTLYIQPTLHVTDAQSVFVTAGISSADVEADADLVTSTNFSKDASIDGVRLGLGTTRTLDDGWFVKLEGYWTDYDSVTFTTSDSTKVEANPEIWVGALSVGRSF